LSVDDVGITLVIHIEDNTLVSQVREVSYRCCVDSQEFTPPDETMGVMVLGMRRVVKTAETVPEEQMGGPVCRIDECRDALDIEAKAM
jgi:hypothetical protein